MRVLKSIAEGNEDIDFGVRIMGSINNKPGCVVRIHSRDIELERLSVRYNRNQRLISVSTWDENREEVIDLVSFQLTPVYREEIGVLTDCLVCSIIRENPVRGDLPSLQVIFAS